MVGRRGKDRYFGRFRCKICRRTWDSAHVYTRKGTFKVLWRQRCKSCTGEDAWVFPYRLQMLQCSVCLETPCVCLCDDCGLLKHEPILFDDSSIDDYEWQEYCRCTRKFEVGDKIDSKKPHESQLCEKCIEGLPCSLWEVHVTMNVSLNSLRWMMQDHAVWN